MAKNLAQQLGSHIKSGVNKVLDRAEMYGGSLGSVNLSEEEKRKRKEQMEKLNKISEEYKTRKAQEKRIKNLKPKDWNALPKV